MKKILAVVVVALLALVAFAKVEQRMRAQDVERQWRETH